MLNFKLLKHFLTFSNQVNWSALAQDVFSRSRKILSDFGDADILR